MDNSSLIFPVIPTFESTFLVGTSTLVLIYIVFIMIYVVLSAVLIYHWSEFGMKSPEVVFAKSLFTLVSIILLSVAGLSIFYYT